MKTISRISAFPFAIILLLALPACKEKVADVAATSPMETASPVTVDAVAAPRPAFVPVEGVLFTVDPAQIRACEAPSGKTRVLVKWDVTKIGVKNVNILVGRGDSELKLFLTGNMTGEKSTGDWIVDGSTLILEDAITKRKLGEIRFHWLQC